MNNVVLEIFFFKESSSDFVFYILTCKWCTVVNKEMLIPILYYNTGCIVV